MKLTLNPDPNRDQREEVITQLLSLGGHMVGSRAMGMEYNDTDIVFPSSSKGVPLCDLFERHNFEATPSIFEGTTGRYMQAALAIDVFFVSSPQELACIRTATAVMRALYLRSGRKALQLSKPLRVSVFEALRVAFEMQHSDNAYFQECANVDLNELVANTWDYVNSKDLNTPFTLKP